MHDIKRAMKHFLNIVRKHCLSVNEAPVNMVSQILLHFMQKRIDNLMSKGVKNHLLSLPQCHCKQLDPPTLVADFIITRMFLVITVAKF